MVTNELKPETAELRKSVNETWIMYKVDDALNDSYMKPASALLYLLRRPASQLLHMAKEPYAAKCHTECTSLFWHSCAATSLCIVHQQGDHLEALAPFVAYKQQGKTFKFMFVGEDDTLFFREGARTAVSCLQETVPYFISGKLIAEQL